MLDWLVAILLAIGLGGPPAGPGATPGVATLDRMAAAVEGAESGHGADPAMWRPHLAGPQGPMQVSAAAAADVGGGNRFVADENRALGRSYLGRMLARYGNWADALAAYNWGPANVDRWIATGRPASGLSAGVRAYIDRVRAEFFAASRAPAPPPRAVPPTDPPPAAIRDPALRKTYLANRAAITQLREFLAATDGAGERAALATIRSIAARPGYGEFAGPRSVSAPSQAALREIAGVMIGKLQSECAAIVLVDRKRAQRLP